MLGSRVSDDVRNFIVERIDSVAQIEALLLVRSNPGLRFSAADVAQRLYIGRPQTDEALGGLCGSGVLTRAGESYGLDGVAPQTLALIDRLLEAYAHHLIPVTNIVHSKPRGTGTHESLRKGRSDT